ncbi:hypothetical protein PR048_026144 [Dryococelus australis]|uniref:Uncharacterized protein n=1 Tax=Dryococelus australis TaxID=614101 RepID=A0ABQ9GKI0_9NEOP|nr:hypothetical protein PR048_026144 [Dryococelus australis]
MSDKTEVARKRWWDSYKERYGLSLRVPENLSAYRASMSNPTMINDYFEKVNHLLSTLGIKDNASRFWNVDETRLCNVVKPNKILTEIGKRFVYKGVYTDGDETHTLIVHVIPAKENSLQMSRRKLELCGSSARFVPLPTMTHVKQSIPLTLVYMYDKCAREEEENHE